MNNHQVDMNDHFDLFLNFINLENRNRTITLVTIISELNN